MSTLGPSNSLSVSVGRYLRPRWYVCGLTVASMLFGYGAVADLRAGRTLTSMVNNLRGEGGGLLVVTQVGECVQTLTQLDEVAGLLQDSGMAVHGLVIKGGHGPDLLAAVLRQANKRFPHEAVSWRIVQPVLGMMGTPALIGVGPGGRIRFVDHVPTVLPGSAHETAKHMIARIHSGAES